MRKRKRVAMRAMPYLIMIKKRAFRAGIGQGAGSAPLDPDQTGLWSGRIRLRSKTDRDRAEYPPLHVGPDRLLLMVGQQILA